MSTPYNHNEIEKRWQKRWSDDAVFRTPEHTDTREKRFILDMFPYPSGSGLHVGHLLGYTGSDIIARHARMSGKAVLHPMGWDSFGLPAENYAIKTQVHPAKSTKQNIIEYKRQLSAMGMSYDWEKELSSSDPEYYRWTQVLFQLLYKKGLAYRKKGMVNWCQSCQTVLANEQVIAGRCERCDTEVVQRDLEQWYFKITQYAERLLQDLETLDWPEKIKAMQRNWIGRSEGAELHFEVVGQANTAITVFTTRPDTLFGATYVVLAPEHKLISLITTEAQRKSVEEYKQQALKKGELERSQLSKVKTGVFTGAFAIHPITKEKLPIWIADYVLSSYGTGAIMAVPAHDERDSEFASHFSLPSITVVDGDGLLINSGSFSSKAALASQKEITEAAGGKWVVTYRLRDWLVSRQRFWGAPIPVAYDNSGDVHLIPETELPVTLPELVNFAPTGQSPLVEEKAWQRVEIEGVPGTLRRETDTLDTFVCSSWYFLRFPNPNYTEALFDSEAVSNWLPVSTYVGGAEHAVLHLLYARFITKALYDEGLVAFSEPFSTLHNQGMILGPDHRKMSKSKGNVINPDDVISELGADTLRVYELFMAPFESEKPWDTKGIQGARRFLERVWRLAESVTKGSITEDERRILDRLVKKVGADIPVCKFNTAIAALMEALNTITAKPSISREGYQVYLRLLSPFAPHICEALWEMTDGKGYISLAPWPEYDEAYCVQENHTYVVQINGKLRARLSLPAEASEEEVVSAAKADQAVAKYLAGATIARTVFVRGKLVSFVL